MRAGAPGQQPPAPDLVGRIRRPSACMLRTECCGSLLRTPPCFFSAETGTGKELVARAVHEPASGEELTSAVGAIGLTETLFESELIQASEKGAFMRRRGACKQGSCQKLASSLALGVDRRVAPGAPGQLLRLLEAAPTAGRRTRGLAAGFRIVAGPPTRISARWWGPAPSATTSTTAQRFPIRSPPCEQRPGRYPLLALTCSSSGSIAAPAAASPQPPDWLAGTALSGNIRARNLIERRR